jgi:hypothetical protein
MTTARKWTVNEDSRLRKMRAGGKTAAVIAKALNRTEAAIFSRSSYLGCNGAISQRTNRADPGFWPVLKSRNREMSERHLKQVEGHLSRSEHHISRQIDIVTKLERKGHENAAQTGRELLLIFKQTLKYQLDKRDRLRAELSALT